MKILENFNETKIFTPVLRVETPGYYKHCPVRTKMTDDIFDCRRQNSHEAAIVASNLFVPTGRSAVAWGFNPRRETNNETFGSHVEDPEQRSVATASNGLVKNQKTLISFL